MVCGFYALLAAHMGEYTSGGLAIIGGIVFDMLDGRVARLVHGESVFGVEFDSLSDFLTFCVSPAYLVYALLLKDYGVGGFVVAFVFALCGGLRLARFNAVVHVGQGSKTHFQGLPTPAAAGFLASFIILYEIVELDKPARTLSFVMDQIPLVASFVPFVVLALAFLMVSNVPYAAAKRPDLLHPRNVADGRSGAVSGIPLLLSPERDIPALPLLRPVGVHAPVPAQASGPAGRTA